MPKERDSLCFGVVRSIEPYDPEYSKRRRLARFYHRDKVFEPGLRGWNTLPTCLALDRHVNTHALLAGLRRRP